MLKARNSTRLIDKNWKFLFDKYDILNQIDIHGFFKITSNQINEFKEARLMTKFDYIDSLPDLFYDNKISILPTKRGEYIIGPFEAYQAIDKSFGDNYDYIEFPQWVKTLDYDNITSESSMINAAMVSGMLNKLTKSEKAIQTVSGRMSTGIFDYKIKNTKNNFEYHNISVKNSQLEIDGSIETEDAFYIIEAKNNITDNFLIRQLYYPYRKWSSFIDKPVIPIYLQHRDGVYNFSIYEFYNPKEYSSIYLKERKNFVLVDQIDTLDDSDIERALKTASIEKEPEDIPFPQADDFIKVKDIIAHIEDKGKITKDEVSILFGVHSRQAAYYLNAGYYLKLFNFNGGIATLTAKGKEIANLPNRGQKVELLSQFAKYESFKILIEHRLKVGRKSTPKESEHLLTPFLNTKYSSYTIRRRSRTIASWIEQLINSNQTLF